MRQFYEYHPVIGYRFTPNLKTRVPHEGGGYLMQVNETGFRSNRPFLPARTPGRKRLLVFGDSFTAGDSVANAQRFTDLLEARIPDLEVYNFGLPNSGTDQHHLIWREYGRQIEHDLVLIVVYVENIRRITAAYRLLQDERGVPRIYAKPYYQLKDGRLDLHHVPVPPEPLGEDQMPAAQQGRVDRSGRFYHLRRLVNALGLRDLAQKLSRYQPVPGFNRPDHPDWLLMRAILTAWVRELDTPVVLMPLPMDQHLLGQSDARPYQARFRELAADLGATLHDPLPDQQRHSLDQRRSFRWEHDVHYTPLGNQVVADSLAPAIARLLNVPAAAGTPA